MNESKTLSPGEIEIEKICRELYGQPKNQNGLGGVGRRHQITLEQYCAARKLLAERATSTTAS